MKISLTLKSTMVTIVATMGFLGLFLALGTGEFYSRISMENQKNTLHDLVQRKSEKLLNTLYDSLRDLGFSLQNESLFKQAFATKDRKIIDHMLFKQLERNIADDGIIRAKNLAVYDLSFNIQGFAAQDNLGSTIACKNLIEKAKTQPKEKFFISIHALCDAYGNTYFSVIIPIGGLRPSGFLQLETDPIPALQPLEEFLGMPIKISNIDNVEIYHSNQWSFTQNADKQLVVTNFLYEEDIPIMSISIASNTEKLQQELHDSINVIMIIAASITSLTAVLSLLITNRTALSPLKNLARQLNKIQENKSYLGEQIKVTGNTEIREITADFNAMTQELENLYGTLEYLALTDQLTQLPNRVHLQDSIKSLISIYKKRQMPFTLFLMDLDRFKQVNDTLGHHAGDDLLQQVSTRLKETLRQTDFIARGHGHGHDESQHTNDVIARLGGDEFAVLLPLISDLEQARNVADSIVNIMRKPFVLEGQKISIDISIGAAFYPEHGDDTGTLMKKADAAMYVAKRSHKGLVAYHDNLEILNPDHFTLETELREAIQNRDFFVCYQPLLDIQSGQPYAIEALIRWEHPEKGLISPDIFIPIAEEAGLIEHVTCCLIEKTFAHLKSIQDDGYSLDLAINISTQNLTDETILEFLKQHLKKHEISARNITIELTENAVMNDEKKTLDAINKLDQLGFRISIDDFGTGYSALSHLKQLPIDEIKIDRSFVVDMLENENDAVIVKATIDMAHCFNVKVIAEGVEQSAHMDFLTALGADAVQGYHIARPMPIDELKTWLADNFYSYNRSPRFSS